jgi:hypothetical protein
MENGVRAIRRPDRLGLMAIAVCACAGEIVAGNLDLSIPALEWSR